MRTALLSLALMLPATASAGVSYGTTMGLGTYNLNISLNGTPLGPLTAGGFMPSFDVHIDRFRIQIHALETLRALADNDVFLGGNIYIEVFESPIGGSWTAVVAPGGALDLYDDADLFLQLTGESQFGVRTRGDTGVGVFVVPAVGVIVGNGESDLVTAGTLQISAWFGGGGGGGSSRGPSSDANNTAPTL